MTVWRILRKAGMKKTKPTYKFGLIKEMQVERLRWCLDYKDWTLKDWMKVIWTDEIAIVIGYCRGGY